MTSLHDSKIRLLCEVTLELELVERDQPIKKPCHIRLLEEVLSTSRANADNARYAETLAQYDAELLASQFGVEVHPTIKVLSVEHDAASVLALNINGKEALCQTNMQLSGSTI